MDDKINLHYRLLPCCGGMEVKALGEISRAVLLMTPQGSGSIHLRHTEGQLTEGVCDAVVDSLASLGYRTAYFAVEKGSDVGFLPGEITRRIKTGEELDHYQIDIQ